MATSPGTFVLYAGFITAFYGTVNTLGADFLLWNGLMHAMVTTSMCTQYISGGREEKRF